MTNEEFNAEVCQVIQTKLPYRLRAPLTLRLGLLDGFWYEVSEACHYMKLSQDDFVTAMRSAATLICEELLSRIEDDARTSAEVKRPAVISQLAQCASTELAGDSLNQIRSVASASGFQLTIVGENLVNDTVFAVLSGLGTCLLLDIGQGKVAWYRFIVATLLRRRGVIQTHPGGYHLGVIAFHEDLESGTTRLELSDIDLHKGDKSERWLSTTKLNQQTTIALPWEYRPQM
jgi:hypothetical protein